MVLTNLESRSNLSQVTTKHNIYNVNPGGPKEENTNQDSKVWPPPKQPDYLRSITGFSGGVKIFSEESEAKEDNKSAQASEGHDGATGHGSGEPTGHSSNRLSGGQTGDGSTSNRDSTGDRSSGGYTRQDSNEDTGILNVLYSFCGQYFVENMFIFKPFFFKNFKIFNTNIFSIL